MASVNPISIIANQTNLNKDKYFFLEANVSTLNVNSISTGSITANTISTTILEASSTFTSSLIATYISSPDVEVSSIYATVLDIDFQRLTADATNLYLNDIPVATTANLSSIGDWATTPAISTVNMDNNNLINANKISTQTIYANTINAINLTAFNIFAFSTYTSTISSAIEIAEQGFFSSISSGNTFIGSLSSISLETQAASISSLSCTTLQADVAYIPELFSVSTINNQDIDNFSFVSISTQALAVSSINGAEFTSTGITVQVAGVSSLVANSISSVGAELRTALVSTLQFKLIDKLDFNFDVGSLVGGLKSGLTNIGIGVGAGVGLVGTGIIASAFSRTAANSITNNLYEQYAVPTQLQFSTLGDTVSSYFRYVSSSAGEGNSIPGQELILSTIISPGTLCIRSLGDPVNLVDPSTYTSSIQAFGQWNAVPPELTTSTFTDLTANKITTSSISGGEAGLLSFKSPLMFFSTGGAPGSLLYTDTEFDCPRLETETVYASTIQTSSITCSTLNANGIITASALFGGGGGLQISTVGSIDFVAANQIAFFNPGGVYLQYPGNNGITYASTLSTVQTLSDQSYISSLTVSSINIMPLTQLGRSTFDNTAYTIEVPRFYTDTNWNVMITPEANTIQVPHASTASISSFLVHAGGGLSAGIAFSWTTIGFGY